MIRRIAIAIVAAAIVAIVGLFMLSWRPAIAPIEHPTAASFSPESIAQGEVLSAEGHCASCHTGRADKHLPAGMG